MEEGWKGQQADGQMEWRKKDVMRGSSSQRPQYCSITPHTAARSITCMAISINCLISVLFSGHSRVFTGSSDLFSISSVPFVLSVIYLSAHVFIPSVSVESNAFQNAMPDSGREHTAAQSHRLERCTLCCAGSALKVWSDGLSYSIIQIRINSVTYIMHF